MAANVPISSSVIPTSTACRHLAMMSLLVRSNTNEESTNESPVPWLPVSWNRSSSDVWGRTADIDKSALSAAQPYIIRQLPRLLADTGFAIESHRSYVIADVGRAEFFS